MLGVFLFVCQGCGPDMVLCSVVAELDSKEEVEVLFCVSDEMITQILLNCLYT